MQQSKIIMIYFDHNSTAIIDKRVSKLMVEFLQNISAFNPSSTHSMGRKARSLLETARRQIAKALNFDLFKDNYRVLFTSCGTEANAIILNSFKQIFCSSSEHVSILNGVNNLNLIPVDHNGLIILDALENILKNIKGEFLVSVMLANNETGVINDIKAISKLVKQYQGYLHCDASQAFGKIAIDIKSLGADFLTISSHKCGGPQGIASLIYHANVNLTPLMIGGKQEHGLRPGTENVLAAVGFGLAAELANDRVAKFKEIEHLRDYLEQNLEEFTAKPLVVARTALRLPNTSAIRMPGVKTEQQLIEFDLNGFMVSAGSACSSGRIATSHVLKAMGFEDDFAGQVIRVSLGPENTKNEIDAFIELWRKIFHKEYKQ